MRCPGQQPAVQVQVSLVILFAVVYSSSTRWPCSLPRSCQKNLSPKQGICRRPFRRRSWRTSGSCRWERPCSGWVGAACSCSFESEGFEFLEGTAQSASSTDTLSNENGHLSRSYRFYSGLPREEAHRPLLLLKERYLRLEGKIKELLFGVGA